MCMSAEALMVFLSLLPADRLDISPDRIVINADLRPAVWELKGERWCTNAPQIDRALRFGSGEAV